jgi:uncharacterized UPF0160 family protein
MNSEKTIVTHDGLFHLDDLFACAIVSLVQEKQGASVSIVRTREQDLIEKADYVIDVGGIYDPSTNRFDHHQIEGAGVRPNGIPYASVGLLWKHYGGELCTSKEVFDRVDEKFVQAIDADDNGVELYKNIREDVDTITIHSFFYTFRPTWKDAPDEFTKAFLELLPLAKKFLLQKIRVVADKLEAVERVRSAYETASDKRIVVMDKPYPADEFLMLQSEPLYKVSPNAAGNAWGVKAIEHSRDNKKNRKDFPTAWAGLRDEALQQVTGVSDAIFCHKALFLATARSKEGALELARLAVEY